jgi:pimeloyl-ACP methyl ester carboxylesterase
MADYRANREDNAQDQVDAEIKITCPVLSLWGADFEAVGKMFDMRAVWAEMANDLRAEAIEQCGHLPHEEQSERVNGLLLEFLTGWHG